MYLLIGIILISTNLCGLNAIPYDVIKPNSYAENQYETARTTSIHNFETYEQCKSTGKLNIVRISRDELFFINGSCFNYYSTTPLAIETFGLIFGDSTQTLAPIVNFTISNVVKGGLHYEIHEGIVAAGDLINATVSKVKVFQESDFQKGCAQEPGLEFIHLLRADISFTAPKNDYAFVCQAVQQPGWNQYVPGLVFPELLGKQRKSSANYLSR